MYEDRPHELLKEMAAKHVMVEISLSSNDLILGVAGKGSPIPALPPIRRPGLPEHRRRRRVAQRLTREYVRAVQTYDLHYMDLKQMVRTGIEHTFLPGPSLWAAPDKFTATVSACAHDALGAEKPSASCAAFLELQRKSPATMGTGTPLPRIRIGAVMAKKAEACLEQNRRNGTAIPR